MKQPMNTDPSEVILRTCRAVANVLEAPRAVEPHDCLVGDLGFDSLRMARLGLSLEETFGCSILLNDWIASVEDPATLNVESLARFIAERLSSTRAA
jgi:acyl carrier protein